MTRTLYDSTNPRDIPASASMVAYYVDGIYAVSQAMVRALFPNATLVPISAIGTNDGIVGDVEPGCMTSAQAVSWVQQRRAAGVDPTIYCNELHGWTDIHGGTGPVRLAFINAGVPEPHYWTANYSRPAAILNGTVGHQYANPTLTGGHYDLSVALDFWPGIDLASGPGTGSITIPRRNMTTFATATSLHLFVRGVQKDPEGQITARPLCHRRYEIAAKSWAAWQVLGGNLGSDKIAAGVDQSGRLHVVVNGIGDDGLHLWEVVSDNDGASWLPVPNETGNVFFDLQGVGDGIAVWGAGSTVDVLNAIGAIPSGTASPVDLSGLTQVVSDAKAAATDAKTAANHADVAAQSAADSAARIEAALKKAGTDLLGA